MQLRACDDGIYFLAWKVLVTPIKDNSLFYVGTFTKNSVYKDSTHIHNSGGSRKIIFQKIVLMLEFDNLCCC
jgi:hypothetical protein